MNRRFCYIVKWCCISLFGGILMGACGETRNTVINFQLDGITEGMHPVLTVGGESFELIPDSLGFVSFYPEGLDKPQDGMLECGKYRLLLYVQPKKSFDVYVNLTPSALGAEFTGDGALENEVLNGDIFSTAIKTDYRQDEKVFIAEREAELKEGIRILDSLALPPDFVSFAKEKLKYTVFASLGTYPGQHAEGYEPSGFYKDYVRNLITEDEKWLDFTIYREALSGWIEVQGISAGADTFERLKRALQFVDTALHHPAVTEFVVDRMITGYVEKAGIDSLNRLMPFYNKRVKDEALRSGFRHLCAMWERIQPGKAAPAMYAGSRDSVRIQPDALTGKYTYLLFWETDCDFSARELAYLKELSVRFKTKNIQFVAVSCDTDRGQWESWLAEKQPAGIQWYLENSPFILDYYRAQRLPYAVLLDPQGKIVRVGMPLPSGSRLMGILPQLTAE